MKIKRLSVLTALILLITSITVAIPASAADTADKYEVLCGLGFFESDSVYAGTVPVTRGDIARSIVNALPENKHTQYKSGETGFTDIDESDSMADVAYNSYILGLLGDEKEFLPDKTATIEDASKMILNLLGYGDMAKASYNRYAAGLGLTKGMPNSTMFNADGLVAMLYNALDTEILQLRPTAEGAEMNTVSGETLLTKILDGGKGRGQVRANRFTGLSGEAAAGVEGVKIGDTLYNTGDTSADSLLGCVVDFYYKKSGDQNILVYVKNARDDRILEFDADGAEFSNRVYTYKYGDKLDKTKKATIAKSADVVYNGKLLEGDYDYYTPAEGTIKLIDSDGNSVYDIVIITSYDVVTVSSVDRYKGTIGNQYNNLISYKVELGSENPSYQVVLKDGTVKKFSDITKYQTIFIAQSMDETVTTIIIPEKTFITGIVDGISGEDIVIDGITYDMTADFARSNTLSPMAYGMFYLDPKGRIGYYEAMNDTSFMAGYLVSFGQNRDTGEDNMLWLKIFTENGEMKVYSTARKYYYTDGNNNPTKVKANNAAEVLTALENGVSSDFGGGQLILYKLNSEGRIREIEIAAGYTDDLAASDILDENGTLRQMTGRENRYHKEKLFELTARYGEDTKIFKVPSNLNKENMFAAYTGSNTCFEWNKKYTFVPFAKRVNADSADYVLAFLSGGGAVDENYVFAVEKVNEAVNADGEPVKVIKGMWGSSQKTYMLDENASETEISSGDILRLGFDDEGNVNTVSVAFDYDNRNYGPDGNLNEAYYSYVAYAYDLKGTTLRVTTQSPDTVTLRSQLTQTFADQMPTVLHYDAANKRFETSDTSVIKTYKDYPDSYSTVYAMFRYADHKMMIVYD